MSEWSLKKLEDLIDIKHGWAFKGEYFSDEPTDYVLLTPGNFFIGGGFKGDKLKYYTGKVPDEYILKQDELIITMTDLSKEGDTLGYPAKIPKSKKRFLHNQRLGLVKLISNDVNLDFLYWLMRTKNYQRTIVNNASGSTVRHTSPSKIKEYEFKLPPLNEQKEISKTLNVLENKIDLLRRQNETLGAISQTLFKRWFVEFEFPDENGLPYKSSGGKMVPSELGEIPEGWRVGILGDEFDILMGQSPPGKSYNEIGEGLIFFQGRTDFRFRFPTIRLYTTNPKRIADKYDVLVSVRAPVGDINIAFDKCCIGRGLSAIKSKYKSYCLYKIQSYKKIFDVFENEGTVFGALNKENFNNLENVIPLQSTIEMFDNIIQPLDKKIFNNENEIRNLSKIRDTLLPKLMSGQIRVKEN